MPKVKFKGRTTAEIENLDIENGSLIYNVENGKTYLDYDDERIPTGGGAGAVVSDTPPENPSENDLWVDTNDDVLKRYNGTNWEAVGGTVTGDTLPIGSIVEYSGTIAPVGWLMCDGSAISRTIYADLFSAIGTTYGSGDGSTTFNLPNLKGRVPVGLDGTDTDFDTLGETGGEKAHTLTVNEIPSHYHQVNVRTGSLSSGSNAASVSEQSAANNYWDQATKPVGGGQAHNILQPYIVVNYIIKVSQVAGLVGGVTNEYSESTEDAYSCDYVNGTVLYEDASGSNTEITLNDNYTNYKRIKVFAGYYENGGFPYGIDSYELDLDLGTRINISYSLAGNGWGSFYFSRWDFNTSNKLTPYSKYFYSVNGSSTTVDTFTRIAKVIGYK